MRVVYVRCVSMRMKQMPRSFFRILAGSSFLLPSWFLSSTSKTSFLLSFSLFALFIEASNLARHPDAIFAAYFYPRTIFRRFLLGMTKRAKEEKVKILSLLAIFYFTRFKYHVRKYGEKRSGEKKKSYRWRSLSPRWIFSLSLFLFLFVTRFLILFKSNEHEAQFFILLFLSSSIIKVLIYFMRSVRTRTCAADTVLPFSFILPRRSSSRVLSLSRTRPAVIIPPQFAIIVS